MSALDLSTTAAADLRGRLACPVHLPGDDTYDAARSAWNLTVDQRPAAVVVPQTTQDVVDAVRAAAALGLRVAPQASGHNAGASAPLDDAVLLRMTQLKGVEIDPDRRRARVAAGCEWKEVVAPAAEHGLAALCGSSPQVSVVGYALGGGIGWLARKHGMATDSIVALDVVTADGELRRVDADHDADLFWAIRGGGGSFGVVTAVELRLFHEPQLTAGLMLFPAQRAAEVLPVWRDIARTCGDELTTSLRLMDVPDDPALPELLRGGSFVAIDGAFAGDPVQADATLRPLRDLGPLMDGWGEAGPEALAYVHMDPEEPMPVASAMTMLDDLPDQAIDELLALVGPGSGSPFLMTEIRQLGGALGRSHAGQGARGAIRGRYFVFMGGVPFSPEVVEAMGARGERVVATLRRWQSRAGYFNFTESPDVDPATLYEPEAYERLRAVRAQVDPGELFLANHEIPPA